MSTLQEQETTITTSRGDEFVRIYTANPFHIARLDKDDRAEFVSGIRTGEDPYANYRVHASHWNPLGGFKRRMSDEQRQKNAERLAKYRAQSEDPDPA